jgi:hypothetical protein
VFGDEVIHVELDYDHASDTPKDLSVPSRTHANRSSSQRNDYFSYRPHHIWPRCYLLVNKWKPKKWRWFSCLCHRWWTPFDAVMQLPTTEPWADQCSFGRNDRCPGYALGECHIKVMGWLLACHQA